MVKDKPLRICMISRKFPILGRAAVHGFLWPVAKGLSQQGHHVTVLSLNSPLSQYRIERDGVTAYYLFEGESGFHGLDPQFAVLKKFMELHEDEEPFDLVHSIDDLGLLIGKQRRQLKVAMVYDVEATHMNEIFSLMALSQDSLGAVLSTAFKMAWRFVKTFFHYDRQLLNTADSILVTSPQQKSALEQYYLYPAARVHTVPYGIEYNEEPRSEQVARKLRDRFGITEAAQLAVCMSDFREIRELRSLLYAFQSLAIKKPKSRLLLVGAGPLEKQIEYEVLSLALGKCVVFAGPSKNTELPDLIHISDVFINLSARSTGFEPSLLEAMAQGKIIIGSEVSPIATIVDDGVHGFLIRPSDTEALTRLLFDLAEGRVQTEGIRRAAQQTVKNMFDLNVLIEKTVAAYRQSLSSAGLKRPENSKNTWRDFFFEFDA